MDKMKFASSLTHLLEDAKRMRDIFNLHYAHIGSCVIASEMDQKLRDSISAIDDLREEVMD